MSCGITRLLWLGLVWVLLGWLVREGWGGLREGGAIVCFLGYFEGTIGLVSGWVSG